MSTRESDGHGPRSWVMTLGLAASFMAGGAAADGTRNDAPLDVGFVSPAARYASPAVTLVWTDIDGLVPFGFEAISSRVAELFADAGVSVAWRRVTDVSVPISNNAAEIPIIILAGTNGRGSPRRQTLAATWRKGPPPHPIWIYPEAVRWTLGLSRTSMPLSSRDCHLLVTPLVRIIAHEVLHSLEPRREHERHGLMKAVYTRSDLLTGGGPLDAAEVRRFLEKQASIAEARGHQPSATTALN
jgi:hypothetical protein